jgi:hypothetical protein
MRIILSISASLLMTGCINAFYSGKPIDPSTFKPSEDAKIRTYNTNGQSNLVFYRGLDCYGSTDGFLATRSGWQSQKNNISLGMPLLPDTYARFDEHVVKANTPLTIKGMYFVGGAVAGGTRTAQCLPPPTTFVPQANKNYEAFMSFEKSRCFVKVREIVNNNGSYNAIPVIMTPSKACSIATGQ